MTATMIVSMWATMVKTRLKIKDIEGPQRPKMYCTNRWEGNSAQLLAVSSWGEPQHSLSAVYYRQAGPPLWNLRPLDHVTIDRSEWDNYLLIISGVIAHWCLNKTEAYFKSSCTFGEPTMTCMMVLISFDRGIYTWPAIVEGFEIVDTAASQG